MTSHFYKQNPLAGERALQICSVWTLANRWKGISRTICKGLTVHHNSIIDL